MRHKFHLMAKEGITFKKYEPLEAWYDVDLGPAYKTTPSAKLLMNYTMEWQ